MKFKKTDFTVGLFFVFAIDEFNYMNIENLYITAFYGVLIID